jgi:hypothetical protein
MHGGASREGAGGGSALTPRLPEQEGGDIKTNHAERKGVRVGNCHNTLVVATLNRKPCRKEACPWCVGDVSRTHHSSLAKSTQTLWHGSNNSAHTLREGE